MKVKIEVPHGTYYILKSVSVYNYSIIFERKLYGIICSTLNTFNDDNSKVPDQTMVFPTSLHGEGMIKDSLILEPLLKPSLEEFLYLIEVVYIPYVLSIGNTQLTYFVYQRLTNDQQQ